MIVPSCLGPLCRLNFTTLVFMRARVGWTVSSTRVSQFRPCYPRIMVKALLYGTNVLVVVCILGTWTQLLMGSWEKLVRNHKFKQRHCCRLWRVALQMILLYPLLVKVSHLSYSSKSLAPSALYESDTCSYKSVSNTHCHIIPLIVRVLGVFGAKLHILSTHKAQLLSQILLAHRL